jgi:metallo-beta-lactamase family protein
MPLKITFLGGVQTVTGSSHLITAGSSTVLLDAGLFQGRRDEFYRVNTDFAYNVHKLNAIVLSHAHIDHSGNIPNVVRSGARCRIYSTPATKDLCRLMLEDSGKIQEEDIRYLNKINSRMGAPQRKPLYTRKEAAQAIKKFRPISYNQRFCVAKNVYATLVDAGHILGSGIVVIDCKDGEQAARIGYAVDLGRDNLPLLHNPVVPERLDYLILETTYGARQHAPIEDAKVKLKDAISRTLARRGKILIPSFALERTQEVLYFLNELMKEKSLPSIPIYVDSPLATDITGVFEAHADLLNDKSRALIQQGNSFFDMLNLNFVRDQKQSKALNTDRRPMIIIAGSGMCESGRILHHLQNTIADSRNLILVVGFMAKDTLGRKIVERAPFVRIFGVEYQLNAEVVIINSFSAHADCDELFSFVSRCLPLKKVFLVHGDPEQSLVFAQRLTDAGIAAHVPAKGEEVVL